MHTQHHQSPLMPLGVPTASQITRTTKAPPKQNSRTGDGRWVSVSLANSHLTPPMASWVALGHAQHHQSLRMPLGVPTTSQITRTTNAPPKQNNRTRDDKWVSLSLANSHITPPMASRVALGHTQHQQSPPMPLGVPTAPQITSTTKAPPKQNSRTGDGRWVSVSSDNHHFTPPMASRVALGHTQHHQSPPMPLGVSTAPQIIGTTTAPK